MEWNSFWVLKFILGRFCNAWWRSSKRQWRVQPGICWWPCWRNKLWMYSKYGGCTHLIFYALNKPSTGTLLSCSTEIHMIIQFSRMLSGGQQWSTSSQVDIVLPFSECIGVSGLHKVLRDLQVLEVRYIHSALFPLMKSVYLS